MGWFNKKEKVVTIEEQKIKDCITNLLKKESTKVIMTPLSKKYFIINEDIGLNVLIDGGAELVKTANHKFKYGWKFREDFINQMIDIVIDWIEKDRAKIEKDLFINEVNLLNDINSLINTLPDKVVDVKVPDSMSFMKD